MPPSAVRPVAIGIGLFLTVIGLVNAGVVVRGEGTVVALSGNLSVETVVAQGCRPIGQPMVITKAERNVIAELGGNELRFYGGNFTEYEDYKKRELGENIDQPHRIKYRSLTRA